MTTITIAAIAATISVGLNSILAWRSGSRPYWYTWPIAWFLTFLVCVAILAGIDAAEIV